MTWRPRANLSALPATTSLVRHYLPISVALALLAAALLYWRHLRPFQRLVRVGGAWATAIVPRFLALSSFLAGTVLLFSGATPAVGDRLYWLRRVLPLPLIEVAHFFSSIAGVGLVVLARGIQRRLDAAYALTIGLLAAGILFTLLKAFDYEEAIFLAVMLALFLPNRRFFYRKTSIVEERFTRGWMAAIAGVVIASLALGWLSYRGQIAIGEMFWQFEANAQAPRFLRATAGVATALLALGTTRLMRPARPACDPPSAETIARALRIAGASRDASSHLVALGDKSLLFSDSGRAFIMYAVSGQSWVALGDPVGPPDEWEALTERFINHAVIAGGWPVFYKVARANIGSYLDFGLSVVKLGEEARVPLRDFSLDGPTRRNLRRVWRRAVDDGATFEVVHPGAIEPLLAELRAVSDDWLRQKATREKSFSLGRFTDDYVRRYPVGIVRVGGRIVAFANVWPSGERAELEADLMRFTHDAPPGIMRYLLVELMRWGRAEGFEWFNLGMAPLAGLRATRIGPLWYQIGLALYGRGERFYNFQGIRAFKDWFYPVWEPRYLCNPGGALRPVILANIAALIAGGYEGVIRK